MPCDDSFCFACIMPSFEGKSDTESKCPLCHQNISLENIHASTKLQKMLDSLLDSLTLECLKSCGQVFKLKSTSSWSMKKYVATQLIIRHK